MRLRGGIWLARMYSTVVLDGVSIAAISVELWTAGGVVHGIEGAELRETLAAPG